MAGIIGAMNKATASNGGAQGGAPARHKKTGRIKMTPDMLSRIDAGGPINRMGIPFVSQSDHLPRLQALEDGVSDIEDDILKLKADIDDDHSDIRAEIASGDDDLQSQIDSLQVANADNVSDLQDQIETITTGMLHEEPVDSICVDPPTAPREDAYYLVSNLPAPTGAFVGHENSIATWNAKTKKWTFTVPEAQETRLVEQENQIYTWNGTKWVKVGSVASKGDSDFHAFPVIPKLAGGDEFPLTDVADVWAKKKVDLSTLRADISTYAADDAQNLKNKGFNLADNSVKGTIDDFNATLTDGYEFATKDDIADFIPGDELKAYAEQQDEEVLTAVAENLGIGIESLHTQITQEIEDAIDAIPDVDPAPILAEAQRFDQEVRDDLDDAIDVQKQYIDTQDNKILKTIQTRFSTLSTAISVGDDLADTRLNALTDDLNTNYSNTAETTAQIDALNDYLIQLLARHASGGDSTVIADIKDALDEIFTPTKEDEIRPSSPRTGGRNYVRPKKPPAVVPKPWILFAPENTGLMWIGVGPSPSGWADEQANPIADPTAGKKPVKGSLVLAAYNDTSNNQIAFCISVYNGTTWVDPWTLAKGGVQYMHVVMDISNPPGKIYGWINQASAGAAARSCSFSDPCTIVFWAEADGFHSLYQDGQGKQYEDAYPFPPGITLADLPPTKYT